MVIGLLLALSGSVWAGAVHPRETALSPHVYSISPELGGLAGGTTLHIQGENFTEGMKVYVGTTLCEDTRVLGPEAMECVTPEFRRQAAMHIFLQNKAGVYYSTPVRFYYAIEVALHPESIRTNTGKKIKLTASGGVPPFTFSVVKGEGQIDKTGTFTAPDVVGAGLIQVKDSKGNVAYSSYQLVNNLGVFPESQTVAVDERIRIGIMGGIPPYRLTKVSGEGKLLQGNYFQTPSSAGTTVLRATDTLGNSADATITTEKNYTELRTKQVAVGNEHSCAIVDGKVYCWGSNASGQLGNPAARRNSTVPVKVLGLEGEIISVVAGLNHTCALSKAGSLKCWGDNRFGQLGDGTFEQKFEPVQVLGMENYVLGVVVGEFFTCAVSMHQLYCWGKNDQGQLGMGTQTDSVLPGLVRAVPGIVTGFSGGASHTCVIEDGVVKCWGNNYNGQLGRGDRRSSLVPVAVSGFGSDAKVNDIVAGWAHTCALVSGAVKCWGFNGIGTLGKGAGSTDKDWMTPADVTGMGSGVAVLTGGQYHNCAILNGYVSCWGYNYQGQVGDSTFKNRPVPVPVRNLGAIAVDVATGSNHSCAMLEQSQVACWGENYLGQLGDGTNEQRSAPVRVIFRRK